MSKLPDIKAEVDNACPSTGRAFRRLVSLLLVDQRLDAIVSLECLAKPGHVLRALCKQQPSSSACHHMHSE